MPRPLTAIAITNAKPKPGQRTEIADGATPGLRLVIQPSGSKSWAFRYERAGGKGVKVTLGPAAGSGAISLADARRIAGEARRGMAGGVDPAESKRADRAASEARREAEAEDRVGFVLDRYIARHVDGLKSAREVRRILNKEVRPVWGNRLVPELTRRDVNRLIDAIAERGAPTLANRVLANVRAWFGWCVERGIITTSPAERIRPPSAEVSRERVLSDSELRDLLGALDRMEWPWRQFYTVALLTGQRREEVAGMRWDELDLDADAPVWVLPSARTKNGREHVVPLVPAVIAAIRSVRRVNESPFIFSTTGRTPISGHSKAKAAFDSAIASMVDERAATAPSPWRLHDLRRTAASGMARRGVEVAVVEKVLNHVSGTFGGIVGVYQRHDFAGEKRAALMTWADHVESLRPASTA